jgi:hypothetical protein
VPRDIVAASGTNLASIGCHYGSVWALLNAAVLAAIQEWADRLTRTTTTAIDSGQSRATCPAANSALTLNKRRRRSRPHAALPVSEVFT